MTASHSAHRPSHTVLYAVAGWGKTSLAAYAPKPIFLMTKGETGLLTLIQANQIPSRTWLQFPRPNSALSDEAETWAEALQAIRLLLTEPHDFKTLCLDTLNGLERLAHEHVCAKEFNSDWGEKGFTAYQRGYDISVNTWKELLDLLDQLRTKRGVATFALCHTATKTVKNPLGPDYDSFLPDLHPKTWAKTSQWADVVLFGNYETQVLQAKPDALKKGKARGGKQRIIHASQCAGWDAKSRHGLDDEILVSSEGPAEAWRNLTDAFRKDNT